MRICSPQTRKAMFPLSAAAAVALGMALSAAPAAAQEPTWLSARADSLRATSAAELRTLDYRSRSMGVSDVGWPHSSRYSHHYRPSYSIGLSDRYRPAWYSAWFEPSYRSSLYSSGLSYGLVSSRYRPSYLGYSYSLYGSPGIGYTSYRSVSSFHRPYSSYFYHSFYRPYYSYAISYPYYRPYSLHLAPVYPLTTSYYATVPSVTYGYTYRPSVLCGGVSHYVPLAPPVVSYSSCYQPYYTYYHPCCPDPCVACLPTGAVAPLQPVPDSGQPVPQQSPQPQVNEPPGQNAPADPPAEAEPPDPGDTAPADSNATDGASSGPPTADAADGKVGPALFAPGANGN